MRAVVVVVDGVGVPSCTVVVVLVPVTVDMVVAAGVVVAAAVVVVTREVGVAAVVAVVYTYKTDQIGGGAFNGAFLVLCKKEGNNKRGLGLYYM